MKLNLLIYLLLVGFTMCAQTNDNNFKQNLLTKKEEKMNRTALQVFQAFGQGMMSGTDSWKDYIAENIKFIGPVDQVNGIEAFIELNEAFMPAIRGNKMNQVIEKDNYVITQIEMQVAMNSGKTITLDMSEWYEIENGKIKSIKVYYDADEFKQEMGMKE